MDAGFASMCAGMEIPEPFIELLIKNKIVSSADFALMASTETEVKTDIFEFAKAGGCELKEVKSQVAVKKLWMSSRQQLPGTAFANSGSASAAPEEEGIPKESARDLVDTWKSFHGFVLPDNWLVTAANQKKIWKAALQSPPQVEVLLMEQLRMHSQRTRISGTMMHSVPGQAVQTSAVDIDTIHAPIEVAMRSKAWFMTTALVCIRNKNWFDFQTAVFASEKIQELVLKTVGGSLPPVEHLNDAWSATIHHFSEQVRITGISLKDVVSNTGGWENKWIWSRAATPQSLQDLPTHVAEESVVLRDLARRQDQSIRDRQRAREIASVMLQSKGNSSGKGNAKGKGKGKGDSDQGRRDRGYERRGRDRSRDRR